MTSPSPARAGDTRPDSAAEHRRHRSVLLDCIRAAAILSVLIFHVATRYDDTALDPVATVFRRFGLLGVDVFFPLSGFLITRYLIHAETSQSIIIFFRRRFLRIIPLYLIAVTLYLAAGLVLGLDAGSIHRIWINYLFLTGWFIYFDGVDTVPYTITWSLSVEEFAYILFGLLAWVSRRNLLALYSLIAFGAFVLRLWLNLGDGAGVYNFPPARLDSIALGGIVAILLERKVPRLLTVLALLTVASYAIAYTRPELWSTLKYTFITFATCALIVGFETVVRAPKSRLLDGLASIGFHSYFTYLFHLFNIHLLLEIWQVIQPGTFAPFWGMVLAALLLTHAQAVISFRYFEGPLMSWGKSGESRGSKHLPTPAAAYSAD